MKKTRYLLMILFILFTQVEAKNKPTINWIEVNYPPAYIIEGKQEGTGFAQKSLEIFISAMPNYSHKRIRMNVNRMLLTFQRKDEIFCVPTLGMAPDQISTAIHSDVTVIAPSPGIVIKKQDLNKLHKQNEISLKELLQTSTLKLGVIDGGLYGKELDTLIFDKYRNNTNIYKRAQVNQMAFYKMLLSNRVDYIIDYAFSYFNIVKNFDKQIQDKIIFLPVIETAKQAIGHAFCNNIPSSHKIITRINQVIKTQKYKEIVTSSLISFLPANMQEEFKKYNMQKIGK